MKARIIFTLANGKEALSFLESNDSYWEYKMLRCLGLTWEPGHENSVICSRTILD